MVTPRKSSRQAAEMQQAQRPGLSGSGFASTGSGKPLNFSSRLEGFWSETSIVGGGSGGGKVGYT